MGTHRRTIVLLLAVLLPLVMPCIALAHNLPARITDRQVTLVDYGELGTVHMLGGYDHLLFVCGITLLYDRIRDVVKAVTLFTVGHSSTLLLATVLGWQVNAGIIDAVIAASVGYVGLELLALPDRRLKVRRTQALILGFGLVHGLGLASRLQGVNLPREHLVERVLAFNVGIEVGQLCVLTAFLTLVYFIRTRDHLDRVRPPAGAALGYAGAGLTLYFAALLV